MPRGVLALVLFAACDTPVGHPPIARIDLTPAAIPAHDQFQTAVTLDGSKSADPIDDPAGTEKLEYQWTILDADARFDTGSRESSEQPVVRFRGERAATITLTVTDPDGNESSSTKYLQLTVK
jgi:extradiol dioxygenase family protein